MTDIMIDLETMGTGTRQIAIVSVGAIAFEAEGLPGTAGTAARSQIYHNVALQSCLDLGLKVTGDTIMWWLKQSAEARAGLSDPVPQPVKNVLDRLSEFCRAHLGRDGCVWSHGATFDVPILEEIYLLLGEKIPWRFYMVHDTRTIFDRTEKLPSVMSRVGGHNALADALAQARHLQRCTAMLRGSLRPPLAVGSIEEEEVAV